MMTRGRPKERYKKMYLMKKIDMLEKREREERERERREEREREGGRERGEADKHC